MEKNHQVEVREAQKKLSDYVLKLSSGYFDSSHQCGLSGVITQIRFEATFENVFELMAVFLRGDKIIIETEELDFKFAGHLTAVDGTRENIYKYDERLLIYYTFSGRPIKKHG